MSGGSAGLLHEAGNPPGAVHAQHAEFPGQRLRYRQAGDRQVGPVVTVEVDHPCVIHFIDMITCKNHRVAGRGLLDRVNILVDRVGGSLVPHLGNSLLGRDHLDVLAQLAAEEIPSLVDMAVQAGGLVLGQHHDLAHVGVDAVGECEVDDPVDPAEGNRRLGAVPGEWFEARSPASCQDDRQHVAIHQTTSTRCPDDRRVLNSTGSPEKIILPDLSGLHMQALGIGHCTQPERTAWPGPPLAMCLFAGHSPAVTT